MASTLTTEQINEFRKLLLARQSRLIQQVQDHFGLLFSHTGAIGELSSYDNHPADLGTELFERGKDLALNEHAERELEEINKALHAIEEGTYGICRVCSMDIPLERLLAIPTTDACVTHASDGQDFTQLRPIEEAVYSANLNPDKVVDNKQVMYDAEDTWQDVARYGTSDTPSDLIGDYASYNEMYANSDEDIGYVEDVERFSSTEE